MTARVAPGAAASGQLDAPHRQPRPVLVSAEAPPPRTAGVSSEEGSGAFQGAARAEGLDPGQLHELVSSDERFRDRHC